MCSKRYYRPGRGNSHAHPSLNYNIHCECDYGCRWRPLDGSVGGVVSLSLPSFYGIFHGHSFFFIPFFGHEYWPIIFYFQCVCPK